MAPSHEQNSSSVVVPTSWSLLSSFQEVSDAKASRALLEVKEQMTCTKWHGLDVRLAFDSFRCLFVNESIHLDEPDSAAFIFESYDEQ
jgi:hypothetical protein